MLRCAPQNSADRGVRVQLRGFADPFKHSPRRGSMGVRQDDCLPTLSTLVYHYHSLQCHGCGGYLKRSTDTVQPRSIEIYNHPRSRVSHPRHFKQAFDPLVTTHVLTDYLDKTAFRMLYKRDICGGRPVRRTLGAVA